MVLAMAVVLAMDMIDCVCVSHCNFSLLTVMFLFINI